MRKGPLCLMLVTLSIVAPAHGEESASGGSSTPLSLSAGSQITELQQRLKESERQREELSKQLQNADGESPVLARLRQENQRLKLQLKEAQASSPLPRLLTDQQQWFVIGAGVALLALLCGIFASGASRKRRQWLN
ncbi:translation initiation factor 2 [Pseudomonas sp. 11/12A]|uniref:translation initiation factor 2 n=1 Tax=Pseudomonas sp. 11/12A TaxID=1506582 RepID=UPI000646F007|nr:translation initiation factor 2 [Pseudomonas sp. 11/12A]